jgi:hypothetical protein
MISIRELIESWPRQSLLAGDLGVPASTVANWKNRGTIPPAYWAGIVASARAHGVSGVTADKLMWLHAEAKETAAEFPDNTTGVAATGLAERPQAGFDIDRVESAMTPKTPWPNALPQPGAGAGHWSKHYGVARPTYRSLEEVNDHVAALRSEWDRR